MPFYVPRHAFDLAEHTQGGISGEQDAAYAIPDDAEDHFALRQFKPRLAAFCHAKHARWESGMHRAAMAELL